LAVCGSMPLVGDQTAALTGVSVGLSMWWEHPQRRNRIYLIEGSFQLKCDGK